MVKIMVTVLIVLVLYGVYLDCAIRYDDYETTEIGSLVSITYLKAGFNARAKSCIITTKGTFVVREHISGLFGKPVTIQKGKYRSYLVIGDKKARFIK